MGIKTFCLYFCFFLVHCLKGSCQDADVANLLKLTLANPGISYELRLGKLQTVYGQAFMKTSVFVEGESFMFIPYNIRTRYFFDPAFTVQFRQYYQTRKQRQRRGAPSINSMNYVALYEEMFFTEKPLYQQVDGRTGYNRIALVWGLQTNISRRFSFNYILGYGYLFPIKPFYYPSGEKMEETLRDTPLIQLTLGLLLNKKAVRTIPK